MTDPGNKLDENEPKIVLKEVTKPKSVFKLDYRKSNICSKMTYSYASGLIAQVNKNKGQMTEDMIIDSSLK
jgi:ABC-type bacteriocin/lantibiotic exporter with double-glycine peptidase domain